MSSESEDNIENTPPSIKAALNVTNSLLPQKSKEIYEFHYSKFMDRQKEMNVNSFFENSMLVYFREISKKLKPSTLWKTYSMLRTTINIKHDDDISKYAK